MTPEQRQELLDQYRQNIKRSQIKRTIVMAGEDLETFIEEAMMTDISKQVKELEAKRERVIREIDAELAKLRTLCQHKRTKGYPARPGDPHNECLDCGKWF